MHVSTDEESATDELDPVWKALGNPIRRKMLDALRTGPLTTGEMNDHFPDHSRFAVMQHLEVLAAAKLIVPRREGRKRYNYLNPVPVQQLYERWVSEYMQPWAEGLVALKRTVEEKSGSA